jgi:hypothetical protein
VDAVCSALREAGLVLAPSDLRIERREERWAVSLPGDLMAWFPADETGRRRLAIERKVLGLIAERCTFRVPRVQFEGSSGFDVRAIVPGRCDPSGLFEQIKADSALAQRTGHALGAMLAQQHARIARGDIEGWLPEQVRWPEPGAWIRERLADVVSDQRLIADIGTALDLYETTAIDSADRALIHGDVGFHNVVVDPRTTQVRGLFDYDSAAWADRHHDFRYLVFDIGREELLDAALAAYEPIVGQTLNRRRIRLYNAVCAASYLAFRRGIPPDQRWCGRTLEEDLRWTRWALNRVLAGN